ncbi:MAG: hypothetical protein SVJ22_01065 [Halobacteriota archaeon]|nr:hypothetical protein [Halobacteriota archaeon]
MSENTLLASDSSIAYPCTSSPQTGAVIDRASKVLYTSWPRFDHFTGGFRSSKITLIDGWDSSFIGELTSLLCVRAVEVFDSNVIYIDGGNSTDPYMMADLCRGRGINERDVLSKILVSRSFTAYQLSTIINERLQYAIREYDPTLLIVSNITNLILDDALRKVEAESILKRSLEKIKDLTSESDLITVVTNNSRRSSRRSPLQEILYNNVDVHHDDVDLIDLKFTPCNQRTLEEFGTEQWYGTYCTNI